MTTRSPERKLFNHYRATLISKLGRSAQDSVTLNKIGKSQFGPAWNGVHAQDQVHLKPNSYQIVNTDTHDKPGQHWLAVYTSTTRAYVWDSYGRPVKRLATHLIENINRHGLKLGATDTIHHMEQRGFSSEVCGQDSMSFLLVVRDLGIRKAAHI